MQNKDIGSISIDKKGINYNKLFDKPLKYTEIF